MEDSSGDVGDMEVVEAEPESAPTEIETIEAISTQDETVTEMCQVVPENDIPVPAPEVSYSNMSKIVVQAGELLLDDDEDIHNDDDIDVKPLDKDLDSEITEHHNSLDENFPVDDADHATENGDISGSLEERHCDALLLSASFPDDELRFLSEDEIVDDLLDALPAQELDATLGLKLARAAGVLNHCCSSVKEPEQCRTAESLPQLIQRIFLRVDDIYPLLKIVPVPSDVDLTWGSLSPRLGSCRLKVVELLVSLLRPGFATIMAKCMEPNHVVATCLDLFFFYTFNNCLHHLIQEILEIYLSSEDENMRVEILKRFNLLDRFMDAVHETERERDAGQKHRRGHMGHIIRICNGILEMSQRSPAVAQLLQGNVAWITFVETKLAELNADQARMLGGEPPPSKNVPADLGSQDWASWVALALSSFSNAGGQ